MLKSKERERDRIERIRGWIVALLYHARPKSVEMHHLMMMLDKRNLPLTRRQLGAEVDYLRSIGLVKIFPSQAKHELSHVEQAKWIQRYVDCDSDTELDDVLCVRIASKAVSYYEGDEEIEGVQRVV